MINNSLGVPEDDSWHERAALTLRWILKEKGEWDYLKKAVKKADFWKWQHFSTGMAIRNFLRSNGFDEKTLNIWNLDDHYIPVMLLALGYKIKGGYENSGSFDFHDKLEKA